VCLVRFMVESPAQSGRMRTLIHPGPTSGVHVISVSSVTMTSRPKQSSTLRIDAEISECIKRDILAGDCMEKRIAQLCNATLLRALCESIRHSWKTLEHS